MSSDRLDRIEAASEANNAQIKANGEQIRQLTGILQIAVRELESTQKESESRIQILIGESRENNRQHAEFRAQITALNEALQSLLSQVVSRVNDLWERFIAS